MHGRPLKIDFSHFCTQTKVCIESIISAVDGKKLTARAGLCCLLTGLYRCHAEAALCSVDGETILEVSVSPVAGVVHKAPLLSPCCVQAEWRRLLDISTKFDGRSGPQVCGFRHHKPCADRRFIWCADPNLLRGQMLIVTTQYCRCTKIRRCERRRGVNQGATMTRVWAV